MLKALVPVDGSENALRAVRHAIKLVRDGAVGEVHLINVQPPVSGDVTTFVGSTAVRDYHREEGEKALATAKAALEDAGVPYKTHITVGPPGRAITEFAGKLDCGAIVMGTRGLGGIAGALLGSVSADVIRRSDVPVTLVK